ncbi:submandibular gland secretory Glx-rich protein CA-like [Hoplias malabaricus]|uniref:submandibular gland secretory Glx-rich protein CA-like n=1 Tax=Hoplias malabaricus TaxID=27720 RepID=UPI00346191BC
MDSDSWRSPLGSESQDEFGSGLWMDTDNGSVEEREGGDPLAPRVEEEDAAALSPELQQTSLSRDFPSPPPPSTEGEEMMESNRGSGDQEWPPEPGQADKPEPINKDQLSESPEGSDSIVFLSEDGEEQGIDCKPLDFTSAREQWVRRDSNSSKPPTPAFSRSSSQDRITEEHHNVPLSHQGEPEEQNPAPNTENREVQQRQQEGGGREEGKVSKQTERESRQFQVQRREAERAKPKT